MSTTGLDFRTSGEIFRKDNRLVLARNRHLASIIGGRLQWQSGNDLVAGQMIALNTSTNVYTSYNPSGASGTGVAVGVLFHDVPAPLATGTSDLVQVILKGEVYKDALVGYDSGAATDLGAREVYDQATGKTIVLF